MKNLKQYLPDVSEEYYRQFSAIHYSLIANFEKLGPSALCPSEKILTKALLFGQLVDTYLTDNQNFDKKFILTPKFDLVSTAFSTIHDVFEFFHSMNMNQIEWKNIHIDILTDAIVKNKFRPAQKLETNIQYLVEHGTEYFDYLKTMNGRQQVTKELCEQAQSVAETIKTNKFLPIGLFKPLKYIEVLPQAKILFNGLKAMYDWLIVNHKDKTIQPCDLKVMSRPTRDFLFSFFQFHYYRQAELYTILLKQYCEQLKDFKDYTILPFIFIVASQNETTVRQFVFEPKYVDNTLLVLNKKVPTMYTLIDKIRWHQENAEYVYTQEEVLNGGKIFLSEINNIDLMDTNTFLNEENI